MTVLEPGHDRPGGHPEGAHQPIDQRHVPHAPGVERGGNRVRQIQQRHVLRHECRRLADGAGDAALRAALGQFAPDEVGNFARGQRVALQVLDHLVGCLIIVVDEARNRLQAGTAGRADAARAMIDQEAPGDRGMLPHRNRRFDAAQPDRGRQFVEAFG